MTRPLSVVCHDLANALAPLVCLPDAVSAHCDLTAECAECMRDAQASVPRVQALIAEIRAIAKEVPR